MFSLETAYDYMIFYTHKKQVKSCKKCKKKARRHAAFYLCLVLIACMTLCGCSLQRESETTYVQDALQGPVIGNAITDKTAKLPDDSKVSESGYSAPDPDELTKNEEGGDKDALSAADMENLEKVLDLLEELTSKNL